LLWRIIIKSEDQYAEGYLSVRNLNQPLEFRITELDQDAVSHARQYPAFGKLDWFTHGFMKTEMSDNKLFVSDLRMGAEPHYVFRYLIAVKTNAEWQEVTPIKQGSRYSWEQLKKILEKI
jgi:inner membrane protein